jgi:hypothetical protein
MTIPNDSNGGSFKGTKAKLTNGKGVMKIKFGTKIHLLMQWMKVSTAKWQQFAQWYNGDDSILLSSPFKPDPTKCKVVTLNCNKDNNKELVGRHKVQLRIIDQLILHVLKNHHHLHLQVFPCSQE